MRKLKLYLDTSVWNFFFADDAPEKRAVTKDFFDLVKQGQYEVFISEVVFKEIRRQNLKKSNWGNLLKLAL